MKIFLAFNLRIWILKKKIAEMDGIMKYERGEAKRVCNKVTRGETEGDKPHLPRSGQGVALSTELVFNNYKILRNKKISKNYKISNQIMHQSLSRIFGYVYFLVSIPNFESR